MQTPSLRVEGLLHIRVVRLLSDAMKLVAVVTSRIILEIQSRMLYEHCNSLTLLIEFGEVISSRQVSESTASNYFSLCEVVSSRDRRLS